MNHKLIFLLMWSVVTAAENESVSDSVFSQEIEALKENDADYKALCACKSGTVKNLALLCDFEKALKEGKQLSFIDEICAHVLINKNAYPLGQTNAYLLSTTKTPKLLAMVKELADKCKVAMPYVMLVPGQEGALSQAKSMALTKNFSIIILDAATIEMLSDDGLRAIVAHELGHVKHLHGCKRFLKEKIAPLLILEAACIAGTVLFYKKSQKGYPWGDITKIYAATFLGFILLHVCGPNVVAQEEEADEEALKLVGPEAFLDAMNVLELQYLQEQAAFENDAAYLETKTDQLSEQDKRFMPDLALIQATKDFYEITLEGEHNGTHPSMNKRIERGEQWLARQKEIIDQVATDISEQVPDQITPDCASLPADQ